MHISKRIRTTLSRHTINLSNDVRLTKQIKKRISKIRHLYRWTYWLWKNEISTLDSRPIHQRIRNTIQKHDRNINLLRHFPSLKGSYIRRHT